jgi:hypothetical protein
MRSMSVEFEPIRLGHGRRRLSPVLLGAVVVVIALGLAVVKPWSGPPSSPIAGREPAADASGQPAASGSVASTAPPASAAAVFEGPLPAPLGSGVTWDAVALVVRPHDGWGIRAIVLEPLPRAPAASLGYEERWFPLEADAGATTTVHVDPTDRSVVGLGISFPASTAPLDVRIWRVRTGGFEWVDARLLDPRPSRGGFLYVRPGTSDGTVRPWPAGTYRVDVLVSGFIRRALVTIPDRFGNVPDPALPPDLAEVAPPVDPPTAAFAEWPHGLFVTAEDIVLPLGSEAGPPLDEAGAWLDLDPGTARAPRDFVATVALPSANGLGVLLPRGSVVTSAEVERLAPEPLPGEPIRVDGSGPGGSDDALYPHVLFAAPGTEGWQPGTYRLGVTWTDAEGTHETSWHVELRPGSDHEVSRLHEVPRLLAAARGWARYAGSTGVLLGTAEPLEGGPGSSTIRLVRYGSGAPGAESAARGAGCGDTFVDGRPDLVGFAHPADRASSSARFSVLLPPLRHEDVTALVASAGVPGLIVVAPATSATFPAAAYRLTVGEGDQALTYALCMSIADFED